MPDKPVTITNLIAALGILEKYDRGSYPTHCEHDELFIVNVTYDQVTPEDRAELEALGFHKNSHGNWSSYCYGSA